VFQHRETLPRKGRVFLEKSRKSLDFLFQRVKKPQGFEKKPQVAERSLSQQLTDQVPLCCADRMPMLAWTQPRGLLDQRKELG